MLFINLLHKLGEILVGLYIAEAKRLHKQAAGAAAIAKKFDDISKTSIDTAANAAAKAQQLDNIFNPKQDTKGESL